MPNTTEDPMTCPTCPSPADPANFGGLCAACETKRQARTARSRSVLRTAGQATSLLGRAVGA